MNAISRPLQEAPADRRDRQLDYFRRAAERAMRAIDIAGDQLEYANASGEPGATASPTLDLARATRALVIAVNAENRVVAGVPAPRAPANDRRRPLLREALHKAADAEPDSKIRATLHRELDLRIEETLLTDPDSEVELPEHLCALADEFHLALDVTTLSDELLGMAPRIYPQPGPYRDPENDDDTDDPDD